MPTPDSGLEGITTGLDGNIWFAEHNDADRIGRMNPLGVVTAEFETRPGTGPTRIVTGPDGNLWFTGFGSIGRMTPTGTLKEFALPDLFRLPIGITAGPDGALWFAEQDGNRTSRRAARLA